MATPNIVPRADSEGGLGTASKYWASAYIDAIYVGAGFVGRDADNNVDFSVDDRIQFEIAGSVRTKMTSTTFFPATNDGISLGTTTGSWSDLFLASGAVINFDNGNATITHSNDRLKINDNTQLALGDGQDLKIYHDGSNTYIDNSTGIFRITQSLADGDLVLRADNGSGSPTPYLTLDGGEGHMIASKELNFADGVAVTFGDKAGGDLEIKEQSSNSYISNFTGNLEITNNTDDGDIIFKSDNGSGGTTAYLTLDGSVVRTKFAQPTQHADNIYAYFGDGDDLRIYHNVNSHVANHSGDLTIANWADDKDVKFRCDDGDGGLTTYFYLDGSSATHDGSATTALFTNWPDKSYISLGTSHDFRFYHNSSHSYIENLTGNLEIINYSNDSDIVFRCDDGSGGTVAYLTIDGSATITQVHKNLRFDDGVQLQLGVGSDLRIFHETSSSTGKIENYTGNLTIQQRADDANITFQCDDGSGGITDYFKIDGNAQNMLASKNIRFLDGKSVKLGTAGDAAIQHDGTDTLIDNYTGDLYIRNLADDKDIIFQSDNGSGGVSTYFYLDGNALGSQPLTRFPDNAVAGFGSSADLRLYHQSGTSYVSNENGGNLEIRNLVDDADVIFSCDDGSGGVTPYLTLDGGAGFTKARKNIQFLDSVKATFGDGLDLEMYHSGSHANIINATGNLDIINNANDSDIRFFTDDGSNSITEYLRFDGGLVNTVVLKDFRFEDNVKGTFGSSQDLKIYHDSTNSYIMNETGQLYILNKSDDKDIELQSDDGSGNLTTYIQLDGSEVSTKILTQKVIMSNLPTSDPTNAGQLWNDSGTLKISAG